MSLEELKECFVNAKKTDNRGKKHKGLLLNKPNQLLAEEYIAKAKQNLSFCEFYKSQGADYKLPEEWFYTMYYCALAILCKFGVESRSQKCTALFLRYVKDRKLIEYDDEFIDRITVHSNKKEESDVDKREIARYGSFIRNEEVKRMYDEMMGVCKKCISQCEEIIFSKNTFKIPEELLK